MRRGLILVLTLSALVAACSGGGGIEVDDPWARTSASNQNNGAVYMVIKGGDTADRLIEASVPSSVAAVTQIHESMMTEDEDGEDMMMMQEVGNIDIPADGEAVLEPGGFHIMLMQLAEPLEVGNEFTVTLTFETADQMDVTVEIREG